MGAGVNPWSADMSAKQFCSCLSLPSTFIAFLSTWLHGDLLGDLLNYLLGYLVPAFQFHSFN